MTSKERIKAAMTLGNPDRTPLMCQFSIGFMLRQLNVSPAAFWFDPHVYADGLIELRKMFSFDGILISLHGHDPDWKKNIIKIEKTSNGENVAWNNGDRSFHPANDLPIYTYKQKRREIDLKTFNFDQLPQKLTYIPVSQNLHFDFSIRHLFDVIEEIVKREGDEFSIHGEVTSPFDYLLDIAGYENALMGLITEPDNCIKIISHFTDLIASLADNMCRTGVDAIKISSPFAGAGLISPKDYKKFVLPFESKIAEAIEKNKVHAYLHTCGAVNDRLEYMFETGISGVECLDPPPLGNVELSDAFKKINNRGFIKGNIDSVNTLLRGSEELILEDARKRIEIGKKFGGFILSTACSIAPDVKKENIDLLRQAVERWG